MGTLDHQIKLTTAQVIFYSLLQVANFTFSNMKFLLFVVAMVAAASAAKQELEAKQEDAATPAFFTGDLLIQQQAIDAIAAADAKLGLIEGKLSAFAGETATPKIVWCISYWIVIYEVVILTRKKYSPIKTKNLSNDKQKITINACMIICDSFWPYIYLCTFSRWVLVSMDNYVGSLSEETVPIY